MYWWFVVQVRMRAGRPADHLASSQAWACGGFADDGRQDSQEASSFAYAQLTATGQSGAAGIALAVLMARHVQRRPKAVNLAAAAAASAHGIPTEPLTT